MTDSAELIDRIVAGVLEQLQAPATAPMTDAAPAHRSAPTAHGTLEIPDAVITAALLENRGVLAGPILFGTKSIVTPSAIDFLASRKIGWSRAASHAAAGKTTGKTIAKWLTVVSRSNPAVQSALDAAAKQSGALGERELVGCHREAAKRGVSALCRGEFDGVIAFTGKPEALACYANRNAQVRAAAVATVERIKSVKRTVGANLFAIDPTEQSAFALRNLLREIVAGNTPAAPADWSE
jgi:hypothetical protein